MVSADDLTVKVWDPDPSGVWEWVADVASWEKIDALTSFNAVGTMTLDLPVTAQTTAITKDRAITLDFRGKRLTYLVADFGAKSDEQGRPVLSVIGADALCLLGDMLAFPAPSQVIGATPVKQSVSRYRATGALEVILADLITANVARRGDPITVVAPLARGGTASLSERMSNVGTVVTEKATAAGLGVRAGLVDTTSTTRAEMVVEFYSGTDKSAWVSLSHNAGTLRTWEQHDTIPVATRAIVGGDGAAKNRWFMRVQSTAGATAETVWNRTREIFVDAKGATTDDDGNGNDGSTTTALTEKGTEALDAAIGQSAFTLEAAEAEGMRWVTHYDIGDLVLVQLLTGVERVERLGGVNLTADAGGVVVKPIPGNPDATDPLFKQAAIIRGLRDRVRALEREDAS